MCLNREICALSLCVCICVVVYFHMRNDQSITTHFQKLLEASFLGSYGLSFFLLQNFKI